MSPLLRCFSVRRFVCSSPYLTHVNKPIKIHQVTKTSSIFREVPFNQNLMEGQDMRCNLKVKITRLLQEKDVVPDMSEVNWCSCKLVCYWEMIGCAELSGQTMTMSTCDKYLAPLILLAQSRAVCGGHQSSSTALAIRHLWFNTIST